jgi:hypothetical protein
MLTFMFYLYKPNYGLYGAGLAQRMGWQSWTVVTMYNVNGSSTKVDAAAGSAGGGVHNVTSHNSQTGEGVEWWNVTDSSRPPFDAASLPLDEWTPLLPHDTGCELFAVYVIAGTLIACLEQCLK